ncbi:MAG: reductive dehalogenase [Dehalogenimonas sp.]
MGNFHTTVSRRDFIKGLGLAGAGLGAASLVAPQFQDLDELSSAGTHTQLDWWVKERDHENPTTGIDWNVLKPYDSNIHTPLPSATGPGGPALSLERKVRQLDGALNNWPGSTLRDLALDGATGGNYSSNQKWNGAGGTRPEQRTDGTRPGPNKWTASPEDNLATCRAAAHFYGSPSVGAIEITPNIKKLFDVNVKWADIDEGTYDEGTKIYTIPNKCKWVLVWMTKQNYKYNQYITRNDPNDPWPYKVFRQGKAGENQAYSHGPQIRYQVNRFLTGLGYQCLKPSATSNVQFGVMSGCVEMGRAAMSLHPRWGLMTRYADWAITDLPLAPSKPIDSGVHTFCYDCMTCAKVCPSQCQSLDREPSWETRSIRNNPGLETWYLDWAKCHEWGGPWDCVACQTACPYNHTPEAAIHDIVRAVAGNTSVFNGFFATMEDQFAYNRQLSDEEHYDWWYRDLRTWKYDTMLGFGNQEW